MERQEKLRLTHRELINKMLEPHGVDYDYVIANPIIEGENWFQHYTWTQAEEEEFKKWAVGLLRKRFRWSIAKSERDMDWFMLYCGLKRSDYGDSVSTDNK